MPAQEFCWFSILAILAIPCRVKQAGVGFAFPMTRCSDDPMTRLPPQAIQPKVTNYSIWSAGGGAAKVLPSILYPMQLTPVCSQFHMKVPTRSQLVRHRVLL